MHRAIQRALTAHDWAFRKGPVCSAWPMDDVGEQLDLGVSWSCTCRLSAGGKGRSVTIWECQTGEEEEDDVDSQKERTNRDTRIDEPPTVIHLPNNEFSQRYWQRGDKKYVLE